MICEGTVKKYSMGRSTGVSFRNWKTRSLVLTVKNLSYMEKPGAPPKHEMFVNGISVVWKNPTKKDHDQADPNKPMFMLRIWSHGVFDLLVDCITQVEKEKWMTGLQQALKDSKGVQWV